MTSRRIPRNPGMSKAEFKKLDDQEGEEAHQLNRPQRVRGVLQSAPLAFIEEEDHHKLDTEIASEEDLIAAKTRMQRLLRNKILIQRLPDKGIKMREKLEKVLAALQIYADQKNISAARFYRDKRERE